MKSFKKIAVALTCLALASGFIMSPLQGAGIIMSNEISAESTLYN